MKQKEEVLVFMGKERISRKLVAEWWLEHPQAPLLQRKVLILK